MGTSRATVDHERGVGVGVVVVVVSSTVVKSSAMQPRLRRTRAQTRAIFILCQVVSLCLFSGKVVIVCKRIHVVNY